MVTTHKIEYGIYTFTGHHPEDTPKEVFCGIDVCVHFGSGVLVEEIIPTSPKYPYDTDKGKVYCIITDSTRVLGSMDEIISRDRLEDFCEKNWYQIVLKPSIRGITVYHDVMIKSGFSLDQEFFWKVDELLQPKMYESAAQMLEDIVMIDLPF